MNNDLKKACLFSNIGLLEYRFKTAFLWFIVSKLLIYNGSCVGPQRHFNLQFKTGSSTANLLKPERILSRLKQNE